MNFIIQVMSGGCTIPPTKPKGRPKKNSIPSLGLSALDTVGLFDGLFSLTARKPTDNRESNY